MENELKRYVGIGDDNWGDLYNETEEGNFRRVNKRPKFYSNAEMETMIKNEMVGEFTEQIINALSDRGHTELNNEELASFLNYYLSLDDESKTVFLLTFGDPELHVELKYKKSLEIEADEALKDLLDI